MKSKENVFGTDTISEGTRVSRLRENTILTRTAKMTTAKTSKTTKRAKRTSSMKRAKRAKRKGRQETTYVMTTMTTMTSGPMTAKTRENDGIDNM